MLQEQKIASTREKAASLAKTAFILSLRVPTFLVGTKQSPSLKHLSLEVLLAFQRDEAILPLRDRHAPFGFAAGSELVEGLTIKKFSFTRVTMTHVSFFW